MNLAVRNTMSDRLYFYLLFYFYFYGSLSVRSEKQVWALKKIEIETNYEVLLQLLLLHTL